MAGDQTSFLPLSSHDGGSSIQPIPEHPPVGPGPQRSESIPQRAAASRDSYAPPRPLESLETNQEVPQGCFHTITPSERYQGDLQSAARRLRQAEQSLQGDSPDGAMAIIHLADAHAAIQALQQPHGCQQDPVVNRLMGRYFRTFYASPQSEREGLGPELLEQMSRFEVERADGGSRQFRFSEGAVTIMDIDPGTYTPGPERVTQLPRRIPHRMD